MDCKTSDDPYTNDLFADSLAALRGRSGGEILEAALKTQPWFTPGIDGHRIFHSSAYGTNSRTAGAHSHANSAASTTVTAAW